MSADSSFDALVRRAMLALGFVAIAVGLVTYVLVDPLVNVLPSSFAIAAIAGVLAFAMGAWMIRSRTSGGVHQTAIPSVELPLSTPAPGGDIDRALYRLTHYREGTVEYRDQIQERLASVAVDVIRQRDDCSREAAVHKLQEGTWTDNEYAASFFAGGSPPSKSMLDSLSDRLTGGGESDYQRWVRITVDTIVERSGIDLQPATDDDDDDPEPEGLLERLQARFGSDSSVTQTSTSYQDISTDDDATRLGDGIVAGDLLETGHWAGITALALLAAGWGIVTFTPSILLLSAIPAALAAYARLRIEPAVTNLDVERHVSDESPEPGDLVDVTVTVRNDGDSYLSDLRLVDRVPPSMQVVEGSPRIATALGSDATATFTYTAVAGRGDHEWPLLVVARDFAGAIEREVAIDVETGIECSPALSSQHGAPVRSQTSLYSGQVDTAQGGAGLEFFSVREYREGDPMKRIDWKRHARTGELATIDFRQERAAKVVLLFDSRDSAYVSPHPGAKHAVDRSVDAAMELFPSLYDRGDLVGVAAFDTVPCWLAPGAGEEQLERARNIFTDHPAISTLPPEHTDVGSKYVDPMTHVRRQLAPEAQVMLFSPLCDDYTAEVARRLDSVGHPVTVISPDPTAAGTIGQRLSRVERTMRIVRLRERGIRIVDWEPEEPLGIELERAAQRWAV
ncbi:conserved repeat domain-containing protein [Natronoarchaeum philippinense]|uniref:Conserved repeat domain-containing protein n=1 Tax=Natronoarchaeum philippinense TaxID=558529 RepID=A0A285PAA9_NATPI|nr:DUF58 domain-containing protein [Natronoarchaeum philippinense]SNZ17076.1 conserved repeat domain-containing protein [Natronoarchaeum philippinense]